MISHQGFATDPEGTSQVTQKDLTTLLKVSASLASTLDLAEVLQIAIESTVDALAVDTGAIYTLESGKLYLGATTPALPPQFPPELRLAQLEDHPHIKAAMEAKTSVYLNDARCADLTPAEKTVVERHAAWYRFCIFLLC